MTTFFENLKEGDEYYYITIFYTVETTEFQSDEFDVLFKETNNIFPKTIFKKEDVERIARYRYEKTKLEVIMRKYSVSPFGNKDKFYLGYVKSCGILAYQGTPICKNTPYCFESREVAEKVIKICGEDNLIKYWFMNEKEYLESEDI